MEVVGGTFHLDQINPIAENIQETIDVVINFIHIYESGLKCRIFSVQFVAFSYYKLSSI